jgi:hypothetical protein
MGKVAHSTASNVNWEKYLSQLDDLLLSVDGETVEDRYLLKWLKIHRICTDTVNNPSTAPATIARCKAIIFRFTQEVNPKLVTFRKTRDHIPLKEYLQSYIQQFFKQIEDAESNLKTIPMVSLRILEDLLFFIALYGYRLNPNLPRLMRNQIRKKMQILLQSFQIEGGSKNLLQDQEKITQGLKASIQPKESPENFNQNPNLLLEKQSGGESRDNLEALADTLPNPDTDLILGQVSFPEEPTPEEIKPEKQGKELESPLMVQFSPSSDSPLRLSGAISNSISQPTLESVRNEPAAVPLQLYHYSIWAPTHFLPQFGQYRYCLDCGKIIHPNTGICTGCQRKYI